MAKRFSMFMAVILLCLSILSAGFPLLSFLPAPARAAENAYYTDMTTKVAKLPKNDARNLYILSSDTEEPLVLSLYPYREETDFRLISVKLFSDVSQTLYSPFNHMYYEYVKNEGYERAYNYFTENLDYNERRGRVYGEGTAERAEACRVPGVGDSFSIRDTLFIDQSFLSYRDYVCSYTNMALLSYDNFIAGHAGSSDDDFDPGYPWSYTFTAEQRAEPLWTPYTPNSKGLLRFNDVFNGNAVSPSETQYLYIGFSMSTCMVTFEYRDMAGDWETSVQQYVYGSSGIEAPEIPVPPYATFFGWDRPIAETVNGELTYKATYTYDKFLLRYQNVDGTLNVLKSVTYYDPFPTVTLATYVAEEDGYTNTYDFLGWSTEKGNRSKLIDRNRFHASSDMSVYPIYELVCSVDSNGDTIFDKDDEEEPPGGCSCSGGIFKQFEKWNQEIKSQIPVPILRTVVYYVMWVVEIIALIALIPMVLKFGVLGIRALVNWIRGMIARRRSR